MPLEILRCGLTSDATDIYLKKIRESVEKYPEKELVLMVPDRFSYLAEKRMCETIDGLGFGNVKVLTLHQLIRKVCANNSALSSVGKQMLLRRIIGDELGEESVFYGTKDRNGFIKSVLDVMNDWKRFCIDSKELEEEVSQSNDSLVSRKLTDLIKIYNKYNSVFSEKQFKDEADLLLEASRIIQEGGLFDNASIWIDAFVEFVPAELSVIKSFLNVGADVHIFLPCPAEVCPDKSDVYYIPYATMDRLVELCKDEGFQCKVNNISSGREMNDELKFLCDFYDDRDAVYTKECSAIEIHKADDIYSEVEHAASKILELVCDKGYKFSDISLLCGNLSNYASCIEAVFDRYSIPYFADYKVPLSNHPVSILLMCVFDILDKKSFLHNQVIRYLKTGYVLDNEDEIDFLSLFIKKRGICGSMWNDDKYFTVDSGGIFDEAMGIKSRLIPEHQKLSKLRDAVSTPLMEYYEKSKGKKTIKEHISAFFGFFERIELFEKIQKKVDRFEEAGNENEASRLTRVWNLLVELFDQMVLAFGDEKVSRNTFGEYLKAGIEASEISIIPSVINGVTVSDAGHRKGAEVKALIILGATSSTVPAINKSDSLIAEEESELFSTLPGTLGRHSRSQSKEFELLTAFSETSDRLYISNAILGSGGEKEEDSFVFGLLKRKFPGLDYTHIDDDFFLSVPETMLHKLLVKIASGQELTPYYQAVKEWFAVHDGWESSFRLLDEAEKYKVFTGAISKDISSKLYEKLTQYSVSRLEKYFQCPFMYFLNFGLKLDDGEEYGMKSTDTGSVVHHALAQYCALVEKDAADAQTKKQRWETITDHERDEIISAILADVAEKSGISFDEDPKMQQIFTRLQSTIKRAADMIALMLTKGQYTIYANEKPFENFKLKGPEGEVDFHGIIDRLDIYEEDDKVYIRVVDYKTGEKKFNLADALNGIDLQLLIYAMAAKDLVGDDAQIAGIFYNSIKKRVVSAKDMSKLAQELKKAYKLSGAVVEPDENNIPVVKTGEDMDCDLSSLGESSFLHLKLKNDGSYYKGSEVITQDKMKAVLNSVRDIATKAARDIKNGDVRVYPYKTSKKDSCKFCPFGSVCMYDLCSGAGINDGESGREMLYMINNNEIG